MNPQTPPIKTRFANYDQQTYPEYVEYINPKERSMLSLEEQKDILTKKDQILKAVNTISEQLPTHQAAGVVANLFQESRMDPTAIQKGGSRGVGYAQYSTGSDRLRELQQQARKQGMSPRDSDFQLRHITNEIINKDSDIIKNAWLNKKNQQKFLQSENPAEAAGIMSSKFLRPGGNKSTKLSKAYKRGQIADFINKIYNLNK